MSMQYYERRVSFSATDEPLRDDVSMLGSMLGEILTEQGGDGLFKGVESARRLAIAHRETGEGSDLLQQSLAGLDTGDAQELVRAFSAFFSLTNLAEQVHRIRRRRAYLMAPDVPQPNSLHAVINTLSDKGLDLAQLREVLEQTAVVPVFTAHPTQATRRTILAKEQRIARLLVDRIEHPQPTPAEEQRLLDRLRTEATLMWQTEEHPSVRPAVADEVEWVMFYVTDVIYRIVPAFYEAVRHALEVRWGAGAADGLEGPRLRFASWVGGDMDGNPNVSAATVRATLARHLELIVGRYQAEVRHLFDHLSQGSARVRVSQEVLARISEYERTMPELGRQIPHRYTGMPYRVLLWQIWERIGAIRAGADHAYRHPTELLADLEIIQASLAAHGGVDAGLALVQRLRDRVRTFGFHLATLDIRQDAAVHREACAELLGDPGFTERPAAARAERLTGLLARSRVSIPDQPSPQLAAVLDVFAAVGECRTRYGDEAIGPCIVSMTHGPDDLLAVLALARAGGLDRGAGLDRGSGPVPIDVAPLFETVDDLDQAAATITAMLGHQTYREHLRHRGDQQLVMLGYSDSAKISGIAASRWALYQTQEQLVRVAEQAGVALTLFHGRGGTVGRGGSRSRDGVRATPCGAVRGRLRVTEQGEIINSKYGLRGIAERTLEVTVGAVVEASALCDASAPPDPAWRQVMATMAATGRTAYDDLIHGDDDLVPYFRDATPIDVIERLAIGSRPPSRSTGQGIGSLRAIPWVFAWMQSRLMVPGWLGIGAGLAEARQRFGRQVLDEMASRWPFFATLLGDVSMVLAKADLDIAAAYAELAGDRGQRVFPGLRAAFVQTRELLLELRNEDELLDREPTLQRSIRLRNPYLDPMSLVQVDLLRRWRAGGRSDAALEQALFETVRGIARGLRNTG